MANLAADFIEDTVKSHMEREKIPGLSLAVVDRGKLKIYSFGVADPQTKRYVDENTLFEIASITKVFTGTAVALEVLDKQMALDVPAINYLPSLKGVPVADFKGVTLAMLLTHTASLPRVPPPLKQGRKYSPQQIMHYLAGWHAPYPLGTKYVYSNLSFGVAGFALEGAMGVPLIDIYRRLILNPLGMSHTTIALSPAEHALLAKGITKGGKTVGRTPLNQWPAAGALISSGGDMAKFLMANLGLLGPTKLIEAMRWAQKGRFDVGNGLQLGLGWQNRLVNGIRRVDKNGGLPGFSSYIGFFPDKKIGVVILANRAKSKTTPLGRRLLNQLHQNKKE